MVLNFSLSFVLVCVCLKECLCVCDRVCVFVIECVCVFERVCDSMRGKTFFLSSLTAQPKLCFVQSLFYGLTSVTLSIFNRFFHFCFQHVFKVCDLFTALILFHSVFDKNSFTHILHSLSQTKPWRQSLSFIELFKKSLLSKYIQTKVYNLPKAC